VRVPQTVGTGLAQVTFSFEAWKAGKVAPTVHQLAVVVPRRKLAIEELSSRFKGSLIHPNRQSQIVGIRFSADGARLAAGDYPGGIVQLWDVATGRPLAKVETGYGFKSTHDYFFLSPDWKSVFAWREKRIPNRIEKDGKRLFRWEFEGEIREWDLATGVLVHRFHQTPKRGNRWTTMSPDGSAFLVLEELPGEAEGNPPRAMSLVDTKTGEFRQLEGNLTIGGQFSADSRTVPVEVVDEDRNSVAIQICDVATGTITRSFTLGDGPVASGWTTISPDGTLLVTAETVVPKNGTWKERRTQIRFRDVATGIVAASFPLEEKESTMNSFDFSPEGKTLTAVVSTKDRAALLVFDARQQKLVHTVVLSDEKVITCTPAFSPDGRWLAVVTQVFPQESERDREPSAEDVAQPRIHLVELATGVVREMLVGPQAFTASVCFSPDGKTLASGGQGQVDLWDVEDVVQNASRDRKNSP
jgi:WD40 repeat protein